MSINEQLTACRIKLNTCKRQLTVCNRSVSHSQDHFPDISLSPEFQVAITETLKEIDAATSCIEEAQNALDSIDLPKEMIIYIKSCVSTILLKVEPSESIQSVTLKIQDKTRNSPDQQRLFYEDKLLECGHTISYYNIQNESILLLVLCYHKGMYIFVKYIHSGIIFLLEVDSSDTIERVKFKIKSKYCISQDQELHLRYADQELENGHSLSDYSIQKESILHLNYLAT